MSVIIKDINLWYEKKDKDKIYVILILYIDYLRIHINKK